MNKFPELQLDFEPCGTCSCSSVLTLFVFATKLRILTVEMISFDS